MTATATTVRDQELLSFGLVESASVNSINDFTPSISNESKVISDEKNEDFVMTFIFHLIFYGVLCISIVLHILIDLGFGYFIKKQFVHFFGLRRKAFLQRKPAFA